ncbi:MATH and LRR domain-containing protein PFE0570w-like [Aphidius gifuensis]|uniref:MATH and LRR domain-containing protein PFE0570w-like n=1 Tax=Aphidius gifuensis TaxID=684658 RepID=UPI001CDC53F5|nr:MATH and LRR domain-containing protein PFE0570w-like [Aphidius gifuensis]
MYNKLLEIFEDMLKNNDVTQLNDINNDPVDIEFITVDEDYDKLNNIDEPAVDIFDDVDDLSKCSNDYYYDKFFTKSLNPEVILNTEATETVVDDDNDDNDDDDSTVAFSSSMKEEDHDDDDGDDDGDDVNHHRVGHEETEDIESEKLTESIDKNNIVNPRKRKKSYVPWEIRKKAVILANKNPTWSLEKISKLSGCINIKKRATLKIWEQQIKNGGTCRDKYEAINCWVYNKCLEYKNNNKKIDNNLLSEWGLEAENHCLPITNNSLKFQASEKWLRNFKKTHGIAGLPTRLYFIDDKMEKDEKQAEEIEDVPLNKRLIGKLKSATSTDSTCDQMDNKNSSINNSVDDDDDEDYSLVEKSGALVPLSEKIRVINTLKNNPDWTAEMIREHTGCKYIRSRKTLLHWIQQVENKKSLFQANKKINDWVFRKCVEYKNKDIILNNYSIINLRNEAKEVLNIDDKFKLPAASTWLTRFKKEYNIIGDASNLILLDMNVISSSSSTASLSSSPDISIDKSINKVNVIPIRLRAKKICVPLDEKTRVVKLAKQIGPNCSFKTLQEKSGCKYLKTRQQLAEWQEQVDKGGPCDYQFNKISNWVYSKCLEEKKNNRIITNSLICCWGIEAKEKFMFTSLKFQATKAWVTLFKRKYKIYGDPNDLKISN